MKLMMLPILALAMTFASAIAVAQQNPPTPGAAVRPRPTANPPAQQRAMSPAEFDKQMAQVQADVNKMQEQVDKLQRTQDPQERQRLLQEHWATMQGAMASMRAMHGGGALGCCTGGAAGGPGGPGGPGGHMMGGPMMGGMMGWQNADQYYSKLTPEQLRQQQYMTDRYVAMQQQMMNHMMWQQHWLSQAPPAKK